MEKKKITEVDHLEVEWMKEAKEQTLETLPSFFNHLMNGYVHDYGTIVKAVSAAMLGTFWAFNNQEGFTGFQVGFIPWFMMDEFWSKSEIGRKVINFDDMVFPQYEFKFRSTISKEIFKNLQERASKFIEEGRLHPDVKKHMESIVAGEVPFGYKLIDEEEL